MQATTKTEPLTQAERAYRRGALQATQYLTQDLAGLCGLSVADLQAKLRARLADWVQALTAARGDEDPRYLGTYLDVIRFQLEDK